MQNLPNERENRWFGLVIGPKDNDSGILRRWVGDDVREVGVERD
jgi:hypothetical protein